MRIIICGSRTFNDKKLLYDTMDKLTAALDNITVVSGAARGADSLGEEWAYANMISVQRYHPQWEEHGKAAGAIRNQEMVDSCKKSDCLVAFWDGSSPGTKSAINMARQKGMQVRVIKYKEK